MCTFHEETLNYLEHGLDVFDVGRRDEIRRTVLHTLDEGLGSFRGFQHLLLVYHPPLLLTHWGEEGGREKTKNTLTFEVQNLLNWPKS